MRRGLLIAVILLLAGCEQEEGTGTDPVSPNYNLLSQCERPDRSGLAGIYEDSLCGTITVWEDREARSGRQIDLNVMVIRARSANPGPDPIVFLAGGPGQAATDIGPVTFARLDELRMDRDILLVDQRGTGNSNSLSCAFDLEGIEAMAMTIDDIAGLQVETMRQCLANFDANPALYTTPIAMDDLNEVREQLGYHRINLYGGSYGTRAALVYLRRHEETVRSVILDSVVPMSMSIPENVALDAQAAFDTMLRDCEEDPACVAAFPDLEEQFDSLITRLAHNPAEIQLEHPRTGEPFNATLEARMVTRLIRSILYDRQLTSLLPLAITEAYAHNYQPLSTLAYAFTGGREQGEILSFGMMTSVLCAEDMKVASGANDAKYFDNAIYYSLEPLCEFWPIGEIPADYFDPVTSDIPVLIASGTLDPITPPKYGIDAENTLPNSTHVIVPGVGHGATIHGCMPTIMAEFLESLDPVTLDTSCAAELKRPPFFTNFAGTAHPDVIREAEDD